MSELAAVRITGDCPECGWSIVVRHRRNDAHRFLGCSRYPLCNWTGVYDDHVQQLVDEVARLQEELRSKVRVADMTRELRDAITFAHPDRWPNAADLANGVTSRLNALRGRLGS